MIIKTLQYNDFIQHRESIKELLIDSYKINFETSYKYCTSVVDDKLLFLDDYVKSGKAILIGAIEGDRLAGFIWLYKHNYFREIRLHVNQIVVDSYFRSRGVGKSLVKEAEIKAKELELESIDLFVSESNREAMDMYAKLGFITERRYLKKTL